MLKIMLKRRFESQILCERRQVKSARRAEPNDCNHTARAQKASFGIHTSFQKSRIVVLPLNLLIVPQMLHNGLYTTPICARQMILPILLETHG